MLLNEHNLPQAGIDELAKMTLFNNFNIPKAYKDKMSAALIKTINRRAKYFKRHPEAIPADKKVETTIDN